MRDLDECRVEILRRSRERIARRKRRIGWLACLLPLCLTVALGTAAVLHPYTGKDTAQPPSASENSGMAEEIAPFPGGDKAETPPESRNPEMAEEIMPFPGADGAADMSDVPDGFAFSFTFGVGGSSFYDSETGQLVKNTADAEGSGTVLRLSEKQRRAVYAEIARLHIEGYPDEYDPQDRECGSDPSMTLILSVTDGGVTKTVRAENIAWTFTADNEKGQAFLDVCRSIRDMLTETDEWQALPGTELVD